MEESKNNKVLIVLVVILCLVIVGLGGFIVYDKLLKEPVVQENNKQDETNEENEDESNRNENKIVDVNLTYIESEFVNAKLDKLAYANSMFDKKVDYNSMSLQEKLNYICAIYYDNKNIIDEETYFGEDGDFIFGTGGNIAKYDYVASIFKNTFNQNLDKDKLYNYDAERMEALNKLFSKGYVSCITPSGADVLDYTFNNLTYDKDNNIYSMIIDGYNDDAVKVKTFEFKYYGNGTDATFANSRFISFDTK